MGICSKRHFLLTICILQLITTVERQVFDFLGFMWAPILVNFFDIIFVILGFFGAFQYRPKYIVSFCIWNTLWLAWNVFIICFYLEVGILDKDGDLLNLGTGSFSWWHVNGPGCKAVYDVTEPELFRPARPANVTDCLLDYQVVEIMHASVQCILGLMAIVGGTCLSKVFLEEDDSFDFVGGDDFGLAGHTPLHPMYVSYTALAAPAARLHKDSSSHTYSTGTTTSSRRSACRDASSTISTTKRDERGLNGSTRSRTSLKNDTAVTAAGTTRYCRDEIVSDRETNNHRVNYPSDDYSNPFDQPRRPVSPCDQYDSLDTGPRSKYQRNQPCYPRSSNYSPVVSARMKPRSAAAKQQSRTASKPRVFADHVRDHRPLRSFYSDPKLTDRGDSIDDRDAADRSKWGKRDKRDSRPLSLYASKL